MGDTAYGCHLPSPPSSSYPATAAAAAACGISSSTCMHDRAHVLDTRRVRTRGRRLGDTEWLNREWSRASDFYVSDEHRACGSRRERRRGLCGARPLVAMGEYRNPMSRGGPCAHVCVC